MKIVTLENLESFVSISDAINFAVESIPPKPSQPKKPYLKQGHTSKEAADYAADLEKYEWHKQDYNKAVKLWSNVKVDTAVVIEEYIKAEAQLNKVPEQYREKLWNYAHNNGHSSGYYEIYLILSDLVEIFK